MPEALSSNNYASIFVLHEDQLTAERMALKYLETYGFESVEFEGINGPITRDKVEYNPEILALFDRAQVERVAGDFIAFTGGGPIFN